LQLILGGFKPAEVVKISRLSAVGRGIELEEYLIDPSGERDAERLAEVLGSQSTGEAFGEAVD
jgi:hypothetical protein